MHSDNIHHRGVPSAMRTGFSGSTWSVSHMLERALSASSAMNEVLEKCGQTGGMLHKLRRGGPPFEPTDDDIELKEAHLQNLEEGAVKLRKFFDILYSMSTHAPDGSENYRTIAATPFDHVIAEAIGAVYSAEVNAIQTMYRSARCLAKSYKYAVGKESRVTNWRIKAARAEIKKLRAEPPNDLIKQKRLERDLDMQRLERLRPMLSQFDAEIGSRPRTYVSVI
jgi:hypothetical protein